MNAQQGPPRGGNSNRGRRKPKRGGRGGGRGGRQGGNRGRHNNQGMGPMGGQQPQYGGFQQRPNPGFPMQPQFNQPGNFNMLGGGFGAPPAGNLLPGAYGGMQMPQMNQFNPAMM